MRIATLLLFLSLVSFTSYTQSNWKFDHITSDDGLSTGTVNCVYKDSKGFIWIGTVDGLNRYDGQIITVFKNDKNDPNSLTDNVITAITEDKNGTIWIGTRNKGISLFDWNTESFQSFQPNILPEGAIRAIHAENNKVVIGILGGGVVVFDLSDKTLKTFSKSKRNISDDHVFAIQHKTGSQYWVSSQSGSIDLLNIANGKSEQFTYTDDNDNGNRKPILQEGNNLWIGTDGNGLIRMNVNSKSIKKYTSGPRGLSSGIITSLYQGKNGMLFIGTDGGGINVLNPLNDQIKTMRSSLLDSHSLSSDAIYQIYEDDSGVIWVSTFRGGINTYSPFRNKFQLIRQIPYQKNSLSFSSVIEVLETKDGYIWIGTDGGGLDMLDPTDGSFIHFKNNPNNPNSISSNVPISMLEDKNGYLWIGTYAGGVNKFDRRSGLFKRFIPDPNNSKSINSRNVWHILEDNNGDLWFGLLDGGLDKYNPITNDFTHYTASNNPGSLSSNLVFTMLEDSKNNFWIGTEDAGLNLFNRESGQFQVFRHNESDSASIINNSIRTLFEDSKGQLWIGTAEGINILNTSNMKISRPKVNKLLPNLMINGILEDEKENIWIASNNGLSKYNPKKGTIQNFTTADGLQGKEFNYTASIKASDGTLYFGGVKGLNFFKPDEVKMSGYKPSIAITSIKLFGESIDTFESNGEPLINTSVTLLDELTLRHDQNILEIGFASMDFTAPKSNNYRYMLEGFDRDWVYTNSANSSANYTNLDPDTYTFRIQGTNSDGIWSNNERILTIKVLPPWWVSWWFITLVSIFIITLAFIFFRWRIISTRKQREELNRRINEATAQIKEQNESLEIEKDNLTAAVDETNSVINQAVESGDFSARINLENKAGQWKDLGESINKLFESILVPFNAINEIINALATSDLSKRYQEDAKGDVKNVTDNLNYAIDNLSELLKSIGENTKEIGAASEEMLITSIEMKTGTEEIATSTAELSTGAQQQVGRIDEASNILESIMEASSHVSHEAKSINEAAEKGAAISDEGKSQMNNMNLNMQKMLGASKETTEAISTLSDKSNKISGILGSIKEIASETNMLALNAAIEAAKAGEAGGGFAVVAEQIRKLAENANHFVVEIENIIDDVKNSIGSTQKSIREMGKDINQSAEATSNASDSFDALAHSYAETLGLSNEIVTHADAQHKKLKEVVQLMESVVVISEEAAAGTEQIASSSNELSSGMNQYSDKTKQVSQIIEKLNERMSQFKLNGED